MLYDNYDLKPPCPDNYKRQINGYIRKMSPGRSCPVNYIAIYSCLSSGSLAGCYIVLIVYIVLSMNYIVLYCSM